MQTRRCAEGGVQTVANLGSGQRPACKSARGQREDRRDSAAPRHDSAHALNASFDVTANGRTYRQRLMIQEIKFKPKWLGFSNLDKRRRRRRPAGEYSSAVGETSEGGNFRSPYAGSGQVAILRRMRHITIAASCDAA
jgi:hypothetical protein